VDYQDITFRLRLLAAKKRLANTRLLILNADYPHWERWICRVSGGAEAIRERLGLELEYLPSAELIKRWKAIDGARAASLAESWRAGAERVLESTDEDLRVVARLYLGDAGTCWRRRRAQGLTMAYGDDPLPVPCLAYMALRDEGLPAACEADILSLLAMVMVHHLLDKPSFMGNIFVNLQDGTITLSHCVAPRRMAGYRSPPLPYTLRDQHWGKAPGSVSAFVELEPGREFTICRLSGDLRSMLLARG
jgi:L-fucose isomerase-like protein